MMQMIHHGRRKRLWRSVFVISVILTCLGAHAAESETIPRPGGTLVIGRGADSISLDPARSNDNESGKVLAQIYEGLVRYKDDSTEVEPDLAVSWNLSDDGKEWNFHLRKGVVFHDGTPFNAGAVVFSFLRQIDPSHPFYRKDYKYASFAFKYVKQVAEIDEYTVRITLEKPYTPFLYNLKMRHGASIVSPEAVEKLGDNFEKHPVGTGPFQFSEWTPEDRIVLIRNKNYWKEPPFLEKLVYRTIKDMSVCLAEFQTGQIDVMDNVQQEQIQKINQMPNGMLIRSPGLNVAYLAMNTEKKPFDNLSVRRAVCHAINKQNLIRLLYQDSAVPAKNPIPPNLWGYNDHIVDYEYNPEKAKKLLAEAGYEKGFDTRLWTMYTPRPYMTNPLEVARAIKGNLSAVGINAQIVTYEWKEYISRTSNGEHDLCLIGWMSDNGDPDNFLYVLFDKDNAVKPKSSNRAFFKNEPLHEILIRAQQSPDRNERGRLYQQAQEIIHDQAPWVPLAHVQQFIAVQKYVQNMKVHMTGSVRYDKAWIQKGGRKGE